MPRNPQPPGELAFIAALRRTFRTPASPSVRLGIGDDCALLRPRPAHDIAVTTDLFLETRHFRRDTHTARSAGHRCLARGLSDLAAMGATPLACFLSLALPLSATATPAGRRWTAAFLAGLHALALTHHVPIAGGDTAQSPTDLLLADIVLLGQLPEGRALTRSSARPGDTLWVSGALGGSAAQFNRLLARANHTSRPTAQHPGPGSPQTFPNPRLALGQALARRTLPGSSVPAISAAIDLSDGLSTDLRHLCTESHVSALLETALLPIHPLARRAPPSPRPKGIAAPLNAALSLALHGGEDYELLFAARPGTRLPRTLAGVPLTRIGTLTRARRDTPTVQLLDPAGHLTSLPPGGYQHLTS